MCKKLYFLALTILFSFTLSSCFHPKTPEKYVIEGIVYKTGFYDGLFTNSQVNCFLGDLQGKSDDLWNETHVTVDDTSGYHISYAKYDIYSIIYGIWLYSLYVSEDQFVEATQYYSSFENFNYYWSKGHPTQYNETSEINVSELHNEKLSQLNSVRDVNSKIYSQITHTTESYYFYKISTDGLLTTLRNIYYIIDGRLYLYAMCIEDSYYCCEIDKELSDYFIQLINYRE